MLNIVSTVTVVVQVKCHGIIEVELKYPSQVTLIHHIITLNISLIS